jgi:predicted nucleic acid-binding protein
LVRNLREGKRLGFADAECIAVAKYRNCLLLTNDHVVETQANSISVACINLPLLLRELWKSKVMSRDQVVGLIGQIERNDRMVIMNKGLILK